jgi:N-acetylmuramoyl-L-alanine amidase
VELVVIHCTELPDLAIAREYGERALYDNGTGNSGHYYIDRDGAIYRYVPAPAWPTTCAATTRTRSASSW